MFEISYDFDSFSVFAINLFELNVIDFFGKTLEYQVTILEGNCPGGITVDQVEKVQTA